LVEFHEKAGLTVKVDEFTKKPSFHGLGKFYLNNAMQDPTYLNEFVGAEIFRAAIIWLKRRRPGRIR
jgi:hypothetical protein